MLSEFGIPEVWRDEVEENVLERIKADAEYAKQARSEREKEWAVARKLYDGEWSELDPEMQETTIFIPICKAVVNRLLTAMMLGFFGQNRFCRVRPQTQEGPDPISAEILDRLVNHYVRYRLPDFYLTMQKAFKDGFIDGNYVQKVSWKRWWHGRILAENRPDVELIPLEDMLIDPLPRSTPGIRFMIHWMEKDMDELWELQDQGIYRDVDKLQHEVDAPTAGPAATNLQRKTQTPTQQERKTAGIYEYWGRLQLLPQNRLDALREGGSNFPAQDIVCTVSADYSVMLREPEPNPYADLREDLTPYEKLPFVFAGYQPEKGEYWGEGMPTMLQGIQEEINRITNERRANVLLNLHPMTLVNLGSGVSLDDARKSKNVGGFVPTNDLDNTFREYAPGNVTQAAYREQEISERRKQELSGVMDEPPDLPETATGAEIYTQRTNARIGLYAQNFREVGVKELLHKLADYIIEWAEPEEVRKILGAQTAPPPLREVIKRDFDIELEAGLEATSRVMQIRNLEHALQILPQAATVPPDTPAGKAVRAIVAKLMPLLEVYDMPEEFQHHIDLGKWLGGEQGAGQAAPTNRQLPAGQGEMPYSQMLGMEYRNQRIEETPAAR